MGPRVFLKLQQNSRLHEPVHLEEIAALEDGLYDTTSPTRAFSTPNCAKLLEGNKSVLNLKNIAGLWVIYKWNKVEFANDVSIMQ